MESTECASDTRCERATCCWPTGSCNTTMRPVDKGRPASSSTVRIATAVKEPADRGGGTSEEDMQVGGLSQGTVGPNKVLAIHD